jgi:glycosyltransferase involved in cell wall biosynthesis
MFDTLIGMKIVLVTETQSGCYKWRGAIPAKYLQRRGHAVRVFSGGTQTFEVPDVMVFFRAQVVEARELVESCRKHSVRVAFDTDDALDLVPKENLNYANLQAQMPVYEFLLREADVVTTTTETLADHLRRWTSKVAVIPNSVDPEEWSLVPKSAGVRVGWTGSPTHFVDLGVALDAIRKLQKKYDFTFVLQGICDETSLDEFQEVVVARWGKAYFDSPAGRPMRHFLSLLSEIRHEFHPYVPIDRHPQKVCDLGLDIGIAPIAGDRFNANKSCIKYYEYAMSGAVTVASRVLPYSSEVPITVKNNRDSWTSQLEWALNVDRKALWREQWEWVMMHRNIQTNVALWELALSGRAVTIDSVLQQTSLEAIPTQRG